MRRFGVHVIDKMVPGRLSGGAAPVRPDPAGHTVPCGSNHPTFWAPFQEVIIFRRTTLAALFVSK